MLAPDISKLVPSGINVHFSESSSSADIEGAIGSHHFNHSVCAVFPDTFHVPSDLKDVLTLDSSYYKLSQVSLHQFVEVNFIDAFIKRGKVSGLSVERLLDVESCACLTPNGHLVLSVHRDKYQELGIDQYKPAVQIRNLYKKPPRYRMLTNVHDDKVCPSSMASYFQQTVGCPVEECCLSVRECRGYNVQIPTFSSPSPEMFEWLGLFSVGALDSEEDVTTAEFLSSYMNPEDSEEVGQVLSLRWDGLISSSKIVNFFHCLRKYVEERSGLPWTSLHMHGFEDAPLSWNLQPHNYEESGENHLTTIMHPSGRFKTCKMFTTIKK